jgi:hypothetical protein
VFLRGVCVNASFVCQESIHSQLDCSKRIREHVPFYPTGRRACYPTETCGYVPTQLRRDDRRQTTDDFESFRVLSAYLHSLQYMTLSEPVNGRFNLTFEGRSRRCLIIFNMCDCTTEEVKADNSRLQLKTAATLLDSLVAVRCQFHPDLTRCFEWSSRIENSLMVG